MLFHRWRKEAWYVKFVHLLNKYLNADCIPGPAPMKFIKGETQRIKLNRQMHKIISYNEENKQEASISKWEREYWLGAYFREGLSEVVMPKLVGEESMEVDDTPGRRDICVRKS